MSKSQSQQNLGNSPLIDSFELELRIDECVAKMLRASNEGDEDGARVHWDDLVLLVKQRSPMRIFEMEVAKRLRA